MIEDHPFIDNNGPTYRHGLCADRSGCFLPSSSHRMMKVQQGKGLRINTVPVPESSQQEPSHQVTQQAAQRAERERRG